MSAINRVKMLATSTGGSIFFKHNRHNQLIPFVWRETLAHISFEAIDSKLFSRAGVIPYYKNEGVIWYAMFIDAQYHTLTDGGGGVGPFENPFKAAFRELNEESMGIFNFTSRKIVKLIASSSQCIYDAHTLLIFEEIHLTNKSEMGRLSRKFRHAYEEAKLEEARGKVVDPITIENCFLVWISDTALKGVVFQDGVCNSTIPMDAEMADYISKRTKILDEQLELVKTQDSFETDKPAEIISIRDSDKSRLPPPKLKSDANPDIQLPIPGEKPAVEPEQNPKPKIEPKQDLDPEQEADLESEEVDLLIEEPIIDNPWMVPVEKLPPKIDSYKSRKIIPLIGMYPTIYDRVRNIFRTIYSNRPTIMSY